MKFLPLALAAFTVGADALLTNSLMDVKKVQVYVFVLIFDAVRYFQVAFDYIDYIVCKLAFLNSLDSLFFAAHKGLVSQMTSKLLILSPRKVKWQHWNS